ncbi:MAG: mechanosensitive ion channel family protein [Oceanicaulis sp.]
MTQESQTPPPEDSTGIAGEAAEQVTKGAEAAVEAAEGFSPETWASLGLGALILIAALVLVLRFSFGEKHRSALRSALRRARMPVLIAGLAFAGALALPATDLPDGMRALAATVIRVLGIIALGWAVGTAGDVVFKRWNAKLDITASDNLRARARATQLNIIRRIWVFGVAFVVLSLVMLSIPDLRNVGVSLFASAGVAGIVIGVAAQPVLSNLVAGLQIAFSQPIRIEDAVVVEGEWGWIEEIGLFHVVIRIWDWRRLVVPLTYFSSTPFQNWTKTKASILGSIYWKVDYRAPIQEMRQKLDEILETTDLWDRQAKVLQVTDSDENTLCVRALASASTSPRAWDLRCYVREQMIIWLQEEYPYALPRQREQSDEIQREGAPPDWAEPPSRRPQGEASNQPVRDETLQEGAEVEEAAADTKARSLGGGEGEPEADKERQEAADKDKRKRRRD